MSMEITAEVCEKIQQEIERAWRLPLGKAMSDCNCLGCGGLAEVTQFEAMQETQSIAVYVECPECDQVFEYHVNWYARK